MSIVQKNLMNLALKDGLITFQTFNFNIDLGDVDD